MTFRSVFKKFANASQNALYIGKETLCNGEFPTVQ
ncbi:hypothetical protein SNOG_06580 [Parastagonospora nodorum SN15]|uniref:Uncharacterized protein n=1 Tax=Phaeosphaeria nodorum (strain SN15 / ATCC MYA-4574 / FGSC 10173) TaxID=321614 RepID=Q0UNT4_PHANO|nr:hypothetical protein SNOG_06580 [Parastagonospora nodorum SN15]EAT86411.1 hypothetical protein SNOG_06580 [Parastagonospora nodorum SN15]